MSFPRHSSCVCDNGQRNGRLLVKILQLEIAGLPHCPRNRSHAIFKKGKASFLGKTEAAHSYEKALIFHLQKFGKECAEFDRAFDKSRHHLVAIWEFHSPEVKTKEGRYSQTGSDLDCHKVLQDTIFRFLCIDDAFIVTDTRTKIQGDYLVVLDLRIKENNGEDLL